MIYRTFKTYKENCNPEFVSLSRLINTSSGIDEAERSWNVDIFPNPSNGIFTIVSKSESEELNIVISDITGKLIYTDNVKTINFLANLDLSTNTGIYFITIRNINNETVTKKLLISE